jgi:hypothetical protein
MFAYKQQMKNDILSQHGRDGYSASCMGSGVAVDAGNDTERSGARGKVRRAGVASKKNRTVSGRRQKAA